MLYDYRVISVLLLKLISLYFNQCCIRIYMLPSQIPVLMLSPEVAVLLFCHSVIFCCCQIETTFTTICPIQCLPATTHINVIPSNVTLSISDATLSNVRRRRCC